MQRDEIGTRQKLVQLHLLRTEILRALRCEEGIEGHDLHAKAKRTVHDNRTDIAAPDDAEHLAGDFNAHEAVLFPLRSAGRSVGFRQLASQRHHHGNGVLSSGDRVTEGRVHHDDALGGRRRDIDIVDPDPGAPDHLEIGRRRNDLLSHLGRRADRQPVILPDIA